MEPYVHNVQYYETDKMGITHHSNYIRWMEEARVDYLKKIGFDYLDMEKEDIYSPVARLENIRFKKPSTVGDDVEIEVHVKSYNGFTLYFRYIMRKEGVVIFEGESGHCFISKEGKLVKLGKDCFPELHEKLMELAEE